MKIYIVFVLCMTMYVHVTEEANFSAFNTTILRFKRAPKVVKVINILYRPSSPRKVKHVYRPPKKLYGPPSYNSLKTRYGSPNSLYGPPKPNYILHGPSKPLYRPPKSIYGPPRTNYGSPKPATELEANPSGVDGLTHTFYHTLKPIHGSLQTKHGASGNSYLPPSSSYGIPLPGLTDQTTHNCGNFNSDGMHDHGGAFAVSATRSPGYELPPPESALVPLSNDPPSASYSSPNAVSSYGTPAHSGLAASNVYPHIQHPPRAWYEDTFGSSSNILQHSTPKTSVTSKRKRIRANKGAVHEFKSPNHNYEGLGVQDDSPQQIFNHKNVFKDSK